MVILLIRISRQPVRSEKKKKHPRPTEPPRRQLKPEFLCGVGKKKKKKRSDCNFRLLPSRAQSTLSPPRRRPWTAPLVNCGGTDAAPPRTSFPPPPELPRLWAKSSPSSTGTKKIYWSISTVFLLSKTCSCLIHAIHICMCVDSFSMTLFLAANSLAWLSVSPPPTSLLLI